MENSMIFNKPVTEIIKKRISVRSYDSKAMDSSLKSSLEECLINLKGPFDSKVRYKLVDIKDFESKDVKLGTYGIIRGVSSFVATSINNEGMSLEQLGYELEQFVLYATSIGLGTCWLGGTFKKGEFAKAMELKGNEILPIVTPIGYPREKEGVIGSLMRTVAGSKNRKSFEELFYNESFDKTLTESEAGVYKDALEMVKLAPSASNKQPWRIVKEGDSLHIYIKHTPGYSKGMGFDMQRVDIGIAMCHLDLTLKEAGINGSFKKVQPDIKALDENTEYVVSWVK
ncbi:nitroreductase family protein [Clostridium sp. YIM B02515]|uniref:Nitroreductase family protein n=1 Tax=Clostridium rhizosphaerae TaxID=2803861 RepID=A0ABS1T6D7_9CLOT|nr:nitroreductase family protein [Clostridium rhizosphaerae]MBL4934312.1 nitroreductase family protein [Clostridium rhizosphaerae]